ncbi:hypothetical protein [Snuella lapsa]|uniref:Glycerophosphoryl diester phosphodiesterase membrane domain-containing protein n=1 Tax=Snuella lapsa TaxID=870481 RepID=A0ABP6Y6B8_9FLAO
MKSFIEFKKQRELADIITDTFGFIRVELKPFLKTVLKISGPYLAIFLLAMAAYTYTVGDIFNLSNFNGQTNNLLLLFFVIILFIVSAMLAYTFATSAVLHYIESYINNNGNVNKEEVKHNTNDTIWSFLGLNVLKWLTLIGSAFICIFPIFYFMVPMTVVLCLFVFEKKDIGSSFSDSFKLIKDEFWITFATIFVLGLIVMVAGYAFSLPASIYSFIKLGVFSGEMDPTTMTSSFVDPVLILLNMISYLFQFILNFISVVGAAFIYFNLNERKNFTGTLERIQSIGKSED